MLAFFEHFSEAALSIIRAFKWNFPGKLILFPQNIELKLFFYEKMKTSSITERGQRINRTTGHFENYLLVF